MGVGGGGDALNLFWAKGFSHSIDLFLFFSYMTFAKCALV